MGKIIYKDNVKLIRIGNSYGVVIPKKVVSLLNLRVGSSFSMTVFEDKIVLEVINKGDKYELPT